MLVAGGGTHWLILDDYEENGAEMREFAVGEEGNVTFMKKVILIVVCVEI